MSSSSDGAVDGDLLPADEFPMPLAAQRRNWRPRTGALSQHLQSARYIVAWIALVALGASLWWMLTWLKPPSPIRLTLVGAAYQENLTVPHNVQGWNSLLALAELVSPSGSLPNGSLLTSAHSEWHLHQPPIVLQSGQPWDFGLDRFPEETLVLYFNAHGAADQKGAYLLPHDCEPTDLSGRLRVQQIIATLSKLPAEKHKLLILDATHFDTNWRYGMLRNDFARSLEELEQDIVAVPNLVVVCAASDGQLSLAGPQNQTLFGHFMVDALSGSVEDANLDGRIDAWEVYDNTNRNIHQWVAENHVAAQQAWLLPTGALGHKRAAEIQLNLLTPAAPSESNLAASNPPPPMLAEAWEQYHKMLAQPIKPFTHSPARWREFEEILLRYESLIQAGDTAGANAVHARMLTLSFQLQWDAQQAIAASQNSLVLGTALTGHSANPSTAQSIANDLWNANETQRDTIWQTATGKLNNDSVAIAEMRIAVFNLIYDRVVAAPTSLLPQAAKIAQVISDPLVAEPTEIHFLRMLERHLPHQAFDASDRERLQTAFTIRQQAEHAALGFTGVGYAYSEELLPWIQHEVREADHQRRLAEDLLFADADDRVKADPLFARAAAGYQHAMQTSAQIGAALALRNEVFSRAPHFASAVAANASAHLHSQQDSLLQQFEALLEDAHQLTQLLDCPPATTEASVPVPKLVSNLEQVVRQTEIVTTAYSTLSDRLAIWWKSQTDGLQPDSSAANSLMLSIPYGAPTVRLALLKHERRDILRHLATPHRTQQQASASQSSKDSKAASLNQVSHLEREQAIGTAVVQGRLALSLIGRDLFNSLPSTEFDSYEQTQYRLKVLPTEDDWRKSFHLISQQIAVRLNTLDVSSPASAGKPVSREHIASGLTEGAKAPASTGNANTQPTPTATTTLAAAAIPSSTENGNNRLLNAARIFGGLGTTAPRNSVGIAHRDQMQSRLLVELAARVELDHWAGLDTPRPFYIQSAEELLQAAKRLWDQNDQVASVQQRLDHPADLQLIVPKQLELTTEPQLQFELGVELGEKDSALSGFPLLWVADQDALHIERPLPSQKLVQKIELGHKASLEACYVGNPFTESATDVDPRQPANAQSPRYVSRTASPGATPKLNDQQQITVNSFFRGAIATKNIPVHLHPIPDLLTTSQLSLAPAMLSVRAAHDVHSTYGKGAGGVAIVLDASGSMGSPRDKPFGPSAKYYEATRALKSVLEALPSGVTLSIWISGQAVGPEKTVRHAEETIHRVVAPVIWNTQDSGRIESILQEIDYPNIEPWNESPIVETILAAKQDLLGIPGYKTVLVITDGMDNRLGKSLGDNPIAAGQKVASVGEALKSAFDHSDICLNVVGFKVEAAEQAAARKQFEVTRTFTPPGEYVETRNAPELARTLTTLLHQRLQYWIDNYANQQLSPTREKFDAGELTNDDKWYPNPLPAGNYKLWNSVSATPTQLFLHADDRMIVQLQRDGEQLAFRRLPYLQTDFSWKPNQTAKNWIGTALENRIDSSSKLSLLFGIELIPDQGTSLLQQLSPADIWFELSDETGEKVSSPMTWTRSYGYPVPTWKIDSTNWKRAPKTNKPILPKLKVWFNPERKTQAAVRFELHRDYNTLTELNARSVDVEGETVVIESASIEKRTIETSEGKSTQQPCLVVRIRHTPGEQFWIRPTGLEFTGKQESYFDEIGKYTGVFWPILPEDALHSLSGIELISLRDLKKTAEQQGYILNLGSLTTPSSDDVAFPPLVAPQSNAARPL